ncbi:MAG: YcxB family protein [Lachnospiraceae bacterium]
MEVEFDVHMTSKMLYDYMLYHMYTSFSGIFGTLIGILLIVNFVMKENMITLLLGIVVIAYLPWTLFLKAKQQMLATPAFKEPLHYKMTDEGVSVSQGDSVEMQTWDTMLKAVSTRGSILLYTSKGKASIFPRKDLQGQTAGVIEMISTHMPPNKVKIRA